VRTDSNIEHFCEDCDHGRSLKKEDYDHGRNPIKIQKYDIFVRTEIMVAVPISKAAFVRTAILRNYDHFVRTAIIVAVLYAAIIL